MQQTSRSKVAILPIILFIGVPFLALIFLRKYGLVFLALFFNPIGTVINQLFTTYRIDNNSLRIKSLFKNREIPVDSIRYVKNKKSNSFQQILVGLPANYQIVGYNRFSEEYITPRKELVFDSYSRQIYFNN